jgi:adenylate cyclase
MSEAIEDAGGHVDKFIGDGIMAVFGMEGSPADGARDALRAADAMGGVLAALNHELREAMPAPLSMGIGLHSGPAILGRVGGVRRNQTEVPQVTALGETVNLASRLEGTARDLGVELVVSAACVARAGVPPGPGWQAQSIPVRGLSAPVAVFVLARAGDLIASDPAAWPMVGQDTGMTVSPASPMAGST